MTDIPGTLIRLSARPRAACGLLCCRTTFSGLIPLGFAMVEFLATSGIRGRAAGPTTVVTPLLAAGLEVVTGDDGVDVEAVAFSFVVGEVSTPAAVLGC